MNQRQSQNLLHSSDNVTLSKWLQVDVIVLNGFKKYSFAQRCDLWWYKTHGITTLREDQKLPVTFAQTAKIVTTQYYFWEIPFSPSWRKKTFLKKYSHYCSTFHLGFLEKLKINTVFWCVHIDGTLYPCGPESPTYAFDQFLFRNVVKTGKRKDVIEFFFFNISRLNIEDTSHPHGFVYQAVFFLFFSLFYQRTKTII